MVELVVLTFGEVQGITVTDSVSNTVSYHDMELSCVRETPGKVIAEPSLAANLCKLTFSFLPTQAMISSPLWQLFYSGKQTVNRRSH